MVTGPWPPSFHCLCDVRSVRSLPPPPVPSTTLPYSRSPCTAPPQHPSSCVWSQSKCTRPLLEGWMSIMVPVCLRTSRTVRIVFLFFHYNPNDVTVCCYCGASSTFGSCLTECNYFCYLPNDDHCYQCLQLLINCASITRKHGLY